jgi:hypothetical protein
MRKLLILSETGRLSLRAANGVETEVWTIRLTRPTLETHPPMLNKTRSPAKTLQRFKVHNSL